MNELAKAVAASFEALVRFLVRALTRAGSRTL
jgi:hypothetical protein